MFKGHCFPISIILYAFNLKLRFSLSYPDIEELLAVRGIKVDHRTTQRWVFLLHLSKWKLNNGVK